MTATLVAIQLAVDPVVLASGASYRAAIEAAAAAALDGVPAGPRLVVFPECAGHVALYALAPPGARNGKTLASVLAAAAIRRPLDVLRGALSARALQPKHAVIAGLAPEVDRYWSALFAELARTHGAYIVAGSHLRVGARGELTNASHLFGPDGARLATTDKVNLLVGVEDAGGIGLARGDAAKVPIVETPLGAIATLIGYDAFAAPHRANERFVAVGDALAARGGCAIVANPAGNPAPWSTAWPDAGPLTGEARWLRDGLPGVLAAVAHHGVTAHLVGGLLDLRYAGASEILTRDADGTVRTRARAPSAEDGGHVVATVLV